MFSKSRTITIITVTIVLYVLLQAWIFSSHEKAMSSLKKNQVLTIGSIHIITLLDKYNQQRIVYHFVPKGKTDSVRSSIFVDDVDFDQLQNLTSLSFQVIYDSLDVSNNLLLLRQSDYQKFGIAFPDSLKWLRKIIE